MLPLLETFLFYKYTTPCQQKTYPELYEHEYLKFFPWNKFYTGPTYIKTLYNLYKYTKIIVKNIQYLKHYRNENECQYIVACMYTEVTSKSSHVET